MRQITLDELVKFGLTENSKLEEFINIINDINNKNDDNGLVGKYFKSGDHKVIKVLSLNHKKDNQYICNVLEYSGKNDNYFYNNESNIHLEQFLKFEETNEEEYNRFNDIISSKIGIVKETLNNNTIKRVNSSFLHVIKEITDLSFKNVRFQNFLKCGDNEITFHEYNEKIKEILNDLVKHANDIIENEFKDKWFVKRGSFNNMAYIIKMDKISIDMSKEGICYDIIWPSKTVYLNNPDNGFLMLVKEKNIDSYSIFYDNKDMNSVLVIEDKYVEKIF
ncbi:MAG: hypothetical protein IKT40_12485 [Bacilli bacterium]|nr:hypothetical protein [Bacilli bacterium]